MYEHHPNDLRTTTDLLSNDKRSMGVGLLLPYGVTTMSITLEYGVIIFFGLLKILDILTTTALNRYQGLQ